MSKLPFFAMLDGPPTPSTQGGPPLSPPTLRDLIRVYAAEELPHKAPKTQYQHKRLHVWLDSHFGGMLLTELTPAFLRQWRDDLLTTYAPGTVCRYLDVISGLLTYAVRELDWLDSNAMRKVRKPPQSKGRNRVLTPDERTLLLATCKKSRNGYLYDIVIIALHSGMRKEEIRGLTWERVDLEQQCVRLIETKNGDSRIVPLVGEALEVMQARHATCHPQWPWVFPKLDGTRPAEFERAWEAAVHKAGLVDFHFHDLRHMAASYLAMSGASLIEIAAILGHHTMRMVQKYSHLTDSHNAEVLARMAYRFFPKQ